MSKKKVRDQPFVILSVDGGGTRGVIATYFLQKLQQKLPLPLHTYFDLFSGTSTGSIITTSMCCRQTRFITRNNTLRKVYEEPLSASYVMDMYKDSMHDIFYREENNPFVSKMIGVAGLVGLLAAVQHFRKYYQLRKAGELVKKIGVKDNGAVISFWAWLTKKYLDPTLTFFREFFTGTKNVNIPGWFRIGFINFVLYLVVHNMTLYSTKTIGGKLNMWQFFSMKYFGTSLKICFKIILYLALFYAMLQTLSSSSSSPSSNESSIEADKGMIFNTFRHGVLFCGLSSGITGFFSGIASGIISSNTFLQVLRKGATQGVLSTIFGGVSGIATKSIYRTWISLFGKEMFPTSRMLMMVATGIVTGIFDVYLLDRFEKNVTDLFSPKYPESKLPSIINEYLGDETKLSDAVTNCLVTSFDIRNLLPVCFTHNDDMTAYKAVVASTSAPTFFKPLKFKKTSRSSATSSIPRSPRSHRLHQQDPKFEKSSVLLDGALWANNPSLVAYAYAKQNGIKDKNIYFLSVGTGRFIKRPKKSFQECGGLEWLDTVLDISLDGMSVDTILRAIFNSTPHQYIRIQGQLDEEIPIDDIDYYKLMNTARRMSEREDWENKAESISKMLEALRRERVEKIVLKPYRTGYTISHFSTM